VKLLAISDSYLPPDDMRAGLGALEKSGLQIVVRHWAHPQLIDLQQANLAIEKDGPDAVPLPCALTENLDSFDLVVVQFAPVNRAFIEAATQLKVLAVLRTGTENVDVSCATQRSVAVLNTPGRLARAVAECTLGLILAEIRNIARAHASLARGHWTRSFPNSDDIPELFRRTVGLVGCGAVGRLVAGYLQSFGCRLLAYDPFCDTPPKHVQLVSLDTLLEESDVVSIHARLTPGTQHLIGSRELALMKRTAVLVNTSRSGLIDEAALIQALSQRQIMGAALDVFDLEPLPPDHPFLRLDNVTLTPHLAGSTRDGFRNSPVLMANFLANLLQGREPVPIVNGIRPVLDSASGPPRKPGSEMAEQK
jgi:D-3-phosphoglycerate dehydrogenase / 2-oxoglutarate reductase